MEQVSIKEKESFIEVLEILKYMDKSLVEKVPKKLISVFEENGSKEYEFKLNPNISLKENNLKEETLTLLAILNLNYWCESEELKKELLAKYAENERKYQEELRQKYNPDDIFKKKTVNKEIVEEKHEEVEHEEIEQVALVEYKESIIKKIINKIKSIFSKKYT